MAFNVTLNAIRDHQPCKSGWVKLLAYLGKTNADAAPLSLLTVLESNGLDDALWCLRAVAGHEKEIRRLACDYALDVIHLWSAPVPVIVKEYLKTGDEKIRAAAWAAAGAARDAAGAAAGAAWDAAWAARDAARAAAWAAAWAARDAARAAARDAAGAARDAAWAAMRKKQTARFKKMVKK